METVRGQGNHQGPGSLYGTVQRPGRPSGAWEPLWDHPGTRETVRGQGNHQGTVQGQGTRPGAREMVCGQGRRYESESRAPRTPRTACLDRLTGQPEWKA